MRSTSTRCYAVLVLAGLSALGCEQGEGQADKQIRVSLAQAHDAMTVGGEDSAATTALTDAANVTAGSPSMRAVAKSSLARNELLEAYKLTGKVDETELDLSRVSGDIVQLALQVRASGTAVKGMQAMDPKDAKVAIAQKVAEAQGGAAKLNWFEEGQGNIPTLAAARQDVSKIQGEIAQLQEQAKNLTGEHDKIMSDAATAAAQSETLKGAESVAVYKKAADLRKQAGDKSIEIDKLNVKISREQSALAVSQGQQAVVENAIAMLQQQSDALDAGWKQVDTDSAKRTQFAAQVLGSGSDSAGDVSASTIASKAEELSKIQKELSSLREQAISKAENAAKHYGEAYTAADEARRALETQINDKSNAGRPELQAWNDLIDAVAPLAYKFQGGSAQRTLGSLYAGQAASLTRLILLRDTVKLAVESIGKEVPSAITAGDLENQRKSAIDAANEAYKTSESLLADVIDGRAKDEKMQASAHVSRTLTLYNWSLLDRMTGDEKSATEHLAAAVADRTEASQAEGIRLPAFPSEIGSGSATTAPSTAPSNG